MQHWIAAWREIQPGLLVRGSYCCIIVKCTCQYLMWHPCMKYGIVTNTLSLTKNRKSFEISYLLLPVLHVSFTFLDKVVHFSMQSKHFTRVFPDIDNGWAHDALFCLDEFWHSLLTKLLLDLIVRIHFQVKIQHIIVGVKFSFSHLLA